MIKVYQREYTSRGILQSISVFAYRIYETDKWQISMYENAKYLDPRLERDEHTHSLLSPLTKKRYGTMG